MADLDRSTIWPYVDAEPQRFYYSRYDNPTVAAAEEELGALEGGQALLFPSGAGATTALVLHLLQPGDTIALAEGCYFGTGGTFKALAKWGLRYVEFDQTGPPPDGRWPAGLGRRPAGRDPARAVPSAGGAGGRRRPRSP